MVPRIMFMVHNDKECYVEFNHSENLSIDSPIFILTRFSYVSDNSISEDNIVVIYFQMKEMINSMTCSIHFIPLK